MIKSFAAKSGCCLLAIVVILSCCSLTTVTGCGRQQPEVQDIKADTGRNSDFMFEAGAQTKNSFEADTGRNVVFSPTHPSFITAREFHPYLSFPNEKKYEIKGRIVSAVVPHHLLAGRLIAGVLRELAVQEPALLVIIGPNHTNKGARIITGYYGWQTPYGVVETDHEAVSRLLEAGVAVKNEEILAEEHSIGVIVPFVRFFLPRAKIVPLILHYNVSLEEVKELLQVLYPFLNHQAVLLSSVDFSHYLTGREAQAKDQETLQHMQNFDYQALKRLGNDHLDSPASLCAAFLWAQNRGIRDFMVLENTNSAFMLGNDFIETTSYFTLVFTED
ncbi:MAG: AmmeMemoRadiSam system protein B [Peptococcaceae bacterium]|nr:AmmeMemoRadiSam system protein B [Peptococcaceae bacterium]